jgi:hypothetical protein
MPSYDSRIGVKALEIYTARINAIETLAARRRLLVRGRATKSGCNHERGTPTIFLAR